MFEHGRPLDQADFHVFDESGRLVQFDEFIDPRIPVGGVGRRAVAARDQFFVQRLAQASEVARPAHFTRESATKLQRKPDRARGAMLGQHPVQGRIREGRIEGFAEFEFGRVHQARIDSARARRANHAQAVVDPDDLGPALLDPNRQRPVAAADIEDMLARLRIEQVERGLT